MTHSEVTRSMMCFVAGGSEAERNSPETKNIVLLDGTDLACTGSWRRPSGRIADGKAAQSAAQTIRAATAIGCAARAVCAVRPVRPVCADRASFPAVPAARAVAPS